MFKLTVRDLCVMFHLDESQVVQEWVAFKCSTNIPAMTASTLHKFEREWLPKKTKLSSSVKREEKNSTSTSLTNRIVDEDVDIISMYANTTPTLPNKTKGKRQVTPDERDALRKRLADSERSPVVTSSRTANSPAGVGDQSDSGTPRSSKFTERASAGQVVASFGGADNAVWKGGNQPCSVRPYESSSSVSRQYKYMFQKLAEKAFVLNDEIEEAEEMIQKHFGIEEFAHIGVPTQEMVQVAGRVACDSQGKLNNQSVILEASRYTSSAHAAPLNLSHLNEYALFPGQVIAADVVNSMGKKLLVKHLYPSVKLPFAQPLTKTEPGCKLHVAVAAGPFTSSDDLQYDALRALLDILQKERPDVCILIGPFVDVKNSVIESGRMNETFEETFRKCMELIAEDTKNLQCQVVLVPSYRDAHHHPVYPQGSFTWNQQPQHMHFMGDPSTLVINNIVFGVTSTDILFHLSAEEVALTAPGTSDRLGRLTQHILNQHSYYPLYPPAEDVNADLEHFSEGVKMTVTPHVLLCPSDLRYFVKDCSGCLCVNPGRLAKGQVGGTYARLLLQPPATTTPTSIVPTAAAQVLRI